MSLLHNQVWLYSSRGLLVGEHGCCFGSDRCICSGASREDVLSCNWVVRVCWHGNRKHCAIWGLWEVWWCEDGRRWYLTQVAYQLSQRSQTLQVCCCNLTFSAPAVPNCCCLKGSAPHWSNPPFLIFDIRAIWRSVLSARVPECQKIKNGGLDQYDAECFGRLIFATIRKSLGLKG